MHFQLPGRLAWAWLLVPVLLLFLVRRRPRQVRVSTLVFFKALAHAYQEAPWLRRLKKLLALLLAAGTVLAAVGALAGLVVAPASGDLQSVLVVMDGSASMAARDAHGRTRMQVARRRVRERLAGLGSGVGVLLMRYDRRPEILVPTTWDRRAVLRALEGVRARPLEGDAESALRLAGRLAALHAPAAIWHVTDTGLDDVLDPGAQGTHEPPAGHADTPGAAGHDEAQSAERRLGLPAGVTLETIPVGLAHPLNVGITAFQIRPRPLERGRLDAFVRVEAQGPHPVAAQVEVRLDGALATLRKLALPPGQAVPLLVPVDATRGSVLEVRVHADGDALPLDDRVVARIPPPRPVRVLWVRAPGAVDPFTQLALASLSEDGVLQALAEDPAQFDPAREDHDVLVLDGWLPPAWPTRTPVLVMQPPGSLGPVHAAPIEGDGLPVDSLRAVDDRHPVLYGVASDRVAVTQTAVLRTGGALAPLWTGAMGPLLLAGEVKGQKLVVMAFAADRSERLGLTAAYPLLLGNAIYWLARDESNERQGDNLRTGTILETGGQPLVWEKPEGTELARETGPLAELDRPGLWRLGERRGSAALVSRRETLLPARPDGAGDDALAAEATRGDLRPLLLWVALALLVLEAWLFHRRAVY
jgi:hypothetical protein